MASWRESKLTLPAKHWDPAKVPGSFIFGGSTGREGCDADTSKATFDIFSWSIDKAGTEK